MLSPSIRLHISLLSALECYKVWMSTNSEHLVVLIDQFDNIKIVMSLPYSDTRHCGCIGSLQTVTFSSNWSHIIPSLEISMKMFYVDFQRVRNEIILVPRFVRQFININSLVNLHAKRSIWNINDRIPL